MKRGYISADVIRNLERTFTDNYVENVTWVANPKVVSWFNLPPDKLGVYDPFRERSHDHSSDNALAEGAD